MRNLPGDIRYAFRQFRHSPVFAITAVLTLALGIGGTTAIFSLVNAVMLRSLPVLDPGMLYRIGAGNDCCVEGAPQGRWGLFSFGLYEQMLASTPEFEQVAAFEAGDNNLSVIRQNTDRAARPLRGEYVTGNYFSTMGIRSFAGRLPGVADDQPAAAPVAVLSYRAWQRDYGADPSVIGANFVIQGRPFSIVGITPPGFFGETLRGDPPDLWMPVQMEPYVAGKDSQLHQPFSAWLRVIGRLRPGANLAGTSERLTQILRRWMQNDAQYPAIWAADIQREIPKQHLEVVPAGGGVAEMKENYGRSLQILFGICALVLLIACANVANLLMARSMARRSQTSIRIAVGASRARVISQSLVESVLLAIGGGIAGLLVAEGAGRILLALAFRGVQFVPIDTSASLPVLGFAFVVSLLTGVLFGIAPAWFATRTDPVEALRGANRSTRDSSSFSRRALLVFQATMSVVLVAGAAMLSRSLTQLEHQDFGLQTENRVSVSINLLPSSYSPDRLTAIYRNLEDRLNAIPGVERSSLALYNPFTGNWGELVVVAGHPSPGLNFNAGASWDRVSPGFFQAAGQPVLRGREFERSDESGAPVAVVNEAFIRRFLKEGEDPLEQHFGVDLPQYANTYRIVGVVRDAKYTNPEQEPRPMYFLSLNQYFDYKQPIMDSLESRSHFITGALLVAHLPAGTLEPRIRKAFAEADPNFTINSVHPLQDQVDMNFDQRRAVAGLAGLFGIVALLLAAVGLYGVTSYTVAQRTNEIGVRMALGARRSNVIQLVLAGAFRMVLIGLAIGIPLSVGAGQLLASQLYGVKIWDPVALSTAVVSLGVCAFIAAMVPAARASSIDPLRALRAD